MTRDSVAGPVYWRERVAKDLSWIEKAQRLLSEPSKNPVYDPQFSFDLSKDILRLTLRRYSQGDPVAELGQSFAQLVDTWELSNRLAESVCAESNLKTCRDWTFDLADLDHYIWCFWLVGLALVLRVPDEQWRRLVALIGEEGADVLLDRVIASREPTRVIGSALLHPKPYARLLEAIDAPKDLAGGKLQMFVDAWYPELNRRGKQQPWWYHYGDPEKHPLEAGSYFGRWCIEAVAVVQAFSLDDSQCLGHPHYPGDLLRPEGPTTHRTHAPAKQSRSWFRFFGAGRDK
ncbi:PoNe immunity protein domain-containing protein [Pseudomonas sp. S2_C03]